MPTSKKDSRLIYLDHAAATPVELSIAELISHYLVNEFYNPSSIYLASKKINKLLEEARSTVARIISAKPAEVIFTSGATESNNLAINGLMTSKDDEIVISGIEHPAIHSPAKKFKCSIVKVDAKGQLDLNDLESKITDKTRLVTVMLANNETGVVQDIKAVADIIKKIRHSRHNSGLNNPIYLHTDASQAANYIRVDVIKMGVDLLTLSSGKIYGPRGVGCLYVNRSVKVSPTIIGGGQEMGLRSGTEPTALIFGFAKALEIASESSKAESKRLRDQRKYFEKQLIVSFSNNIVINSNAKKSLPNIINVSFIGQDGERLIMELDERGVQASTGSACAAANRPGEKSPTLRSMEVDEHTIGSSVRFSMGRSTTRSDLDYVLKALNSIIKS